MKTVDWWFFSFKFFFFYGLCFSSDNIVIIKRTIYIYIYAHIIRDRTILLSSPFFSTTVVVRQNISFKDIKRSHILIGNSVRKLIRDFRL